LAHAGARGADAREVRGRFHAFGEDLAHRAKGAFLRRAARAVGHGTEQRRTRIQLLAHAAQLFGALGRLGREELETDRQAHAGLLTKTKNSRLPSPPAMALSK